MMILHAELLMQSRRAQVAVHDADRAASLRGEFFSDTRQHPTAAAAGLRARENNSPDTLWTQKQFLHELYDLLLRGRICLERSYSRNILLNRRHCR
jgi:hypothetical protein